VSKADGGEATDEAQRRAAGAEREAGPVQDESGGDAPQYPPTGPLLRPAQRNWLGLYFVVLSVVTFYVLIATWPVVKLGQQRSEFVDARLFGLIKVAAPPDSRLFITVVAAGALGSLVHVLTSFADYVGNRDLRQSWIWFLMLRTPIGIALALLFYLVLRGGLIVPNLPEGNGHDPTATLISPFGLAAIAAMAGMFSKQATDKLSEVFSTLFQTSKPVPRADPLKPTKPLIVSTEPTTLKVGDSPHLALIGRNFDQQCTVTVSGKERAAKWESATRITIALDPVEDLKTPGKLMLIVRNPAAAGGDSAALGVEVVGRSAGGDAGATKTTDTKGLEAGAAAPH
jgi:hypothetical protein